MVDIYPEIALKKPALVEMTPIRRKPHDANFQGAMSADDVEQSTGVEKIKGDDASPLQVRILRSGIVPRQPSTTGLAEGTTAVAARRVLATSS